MLHDSLTEGGHGTVVLLSGPAGIGKTHLADELARLAADAGAQVMWGRCREDAGAPAYWPWRQLLRHHRPAAEQAPADPQQARLLAQLAPGLFGPAAEPPDSDVSSGPDQARFQLYHAVAELFAETAQHRPLLLLLDDLHRADTPSLRLLEFVAAELHATPALILGTYRDSDVPTGHQFEQTLSECSRLPYYHHLQLGNLDPAAARELLDRALPDLDPALFEQVYQRTEGHPLYLVETARHLSQGGAGDALPASLKAIIGQRFGRLPPATLHALQAASVIGRRFTLELLGALYDSPDGIDSALTALDPALQQGQIETLATPGHYQFGHALIRETLYDSLDGSKQLHLHRNLAEILEQRGDDLAQTAYHYHQAAPLGVADKAAHFSEQAAREADRMMAYEVAARYYRQALNTAAKDRTAALSLALGRAQMRAGESLQALATFDQAAELAERGGEQNAVRAGRHRHGRGPVAAGTARR